METITGVILLATLVEGAITYLFGENTSGTKREWLKFVSLMLGIILAIFYGLDFFLILGLNPMFPVVGFVLTGFLISRGSNYIHEFLDTFKKNSNTQ